MWLTMSFLALTDPGNILEQSSYYLWPSQPPPFKSNPPVSHSPGGPQAKFRATVQQRFPSPESRWQESGLLKLEHLHPGFWLKKR